MVAPSPPPKKNWRGRTSLLLPTGAENISYAPGPFNAPSFFGVWVEWSRGKSNYQARCRSTTGRSWPSVTWWRRIEPWTPDDVMRTSCAGRSVTNVCATPQQDEFFLHRDAMLARCMLSKRLNAWSWLLARKLPSILPAVRKFGYLQKMGTLLWNFVPYSWVRKFRHGNSTVLSTKLVNGWACGSYTYDGLRAVANRT